MKVAVLVVILLVRVFSAHAQEKGSVAKILVQINGLRNDKGNVAVALYNSRDGFPEDSGKIVRSDFGKITSGKSFVIFSQVPYGTYAISVLHDENENGKMDKGMFGVPREGYGFSKDVMGFLGPPDFEKAKFVCDRDTVYVTIKMRY